MSREAMREALTFASEFFRARALMASPGDAKLRLNSCEAACQQAIEMLDAQTPRVMTLAEALAADYVYLEIKLHASLPCDCCILAIDPDGGILPLKKGFAGYLDGEEYGETWRCWTQRPTEEQRRDTPWPT